MIDAASNSENDVLAQVRRLIRAHNRCALGTESAQDQRAYVSLTALATDSGGAPLMLLSQLSEHCRNAASDPRVSLLLDGTQNYANPLEGPRASLQGVLEASAEPEHRRRFLARHPGAKLYADFTDFGMFRLRVERIHWVGGFARARWFDGGAELPSDVAARFAEAEPGLIERLNRERPDLGAKLVGGKSNDPGQDFSIVAIDPDGCDFGAGDTVTRFALSMSIADPREAEAEFLRLGGTA